MSNAETMSSTETWKAWEGRIVDGKFPLRQWLGGSDHSAVFLTERSGGEPRKAAIKLIAADPADADVQLARWRAAAQLAHPSVICIYESGRCRLNDASLLYVVMECAEEDLAQILPQRALTPAEVGDLLPPLLDGLSFLHEKGFVHGRIKPSNILAVGEQLKLSADQITSLGEPDSVGKRRDVYDAPETAAGIVSPAGDLWSVGVTLIAALTQNVTLGDEASQGSRGPGLPESIPEPFRGIARECLQLDPNRRCSVADIKARLLPPARSVPAKVEATAVRRRPVNRGPIVVAALIVVVIVGAFIFYPRGRSGGDSAGASGGGASGGVSGGNDSKVQPAPSTSEQPAAQQPAAVAPPVQQPVQPTVQPVQPPATSAKKAGGSASKAAVIHQVIPDVPKSARNTIRGTIKVSVRVDVDSYGKVSSARLASSGPSRYFADMALKAARGWEFSAPEMNGQPVASAWVVQFRFKRNGTQASVEGAKR